MVFFVLFRIVSQNAVASRLSLLLPLFADVKRLAVVLSSRTQTIPILIRVLFVAQCTTPMVYLGFR